MPFITFEGIDGSGKSSLIKTFAQYIQTLGVSIKITREPGGTELGVELRTLLLRTGKTPPCPQAELLIYEADRAQHVATVVKPLLDKGIWVISDRYGDSSIAFQGAGRHISTEDVTWLNRFATGGLTPDLTVLLDCPVDVALSRQKQREKTQKQEADRFEQEHRDFHEAVRQGYLKLAKETPPRFLVLDATQDTHTLLEKLIQTVKSKGWLK